MNFVMFVFGFFGIVIGICIGVPLLVCFFPLIAGLYFGFAIGTAEGAGAGSYIGGLIIIIIGIVGECFWVSKVLGKYDSGIKLPRMYK
jgi:hypothetical protein